MKLHRRDNGVWYCRIDGKRTSTGCTDRAAAACVAADLLREAERTRAGLVPISRASAALTWPQAVYEWAEDMTRAGRDVRYIAGVKDSLGRIGKAAGLRYPREASREAWGIVEAGILSKLAPKSRNNHRAGLLAFLSWCKGRGLILAVPNLPDPVPDRNPIRRRALTVEEVRALLTCPAIPDQRRRVYAFLTYTGLRRGEAAAMTWAWVCSDWLEIPPDHAKSRRAERVPLSPAARAAMGQPGTGLVWGAIPSARTFAADLKRAGISAIDGRGRVAVLHSLRASCNSILASVGVNQTQRRAILRHRSEAVNARYIDDELLGLSDAVGKIGNMAV